MDNRLKIIETDEEIKVFTDPYRNKIINTFLSEDRPLTVKMVADILGEVPAKVHYHVKKILKINLIELDHIEVINGINAKYYKMLYDNFKLKINQNQDERLINTQLDHVTKMLVSIIDEFKSDVLNRVEDLEDNFHNSDYEGFISQIKLTLTEENYDEFNNEFKTLIKKYTSKKNEGTSYSFLLGLIRKDKEKDE
ncbi:MAG: hypothetical protein K9L74_01505 [Candidatus Izimaplasma sp.]|nr:hypothetical protein [Candidatus Izimaplasma bacterium]